MRKIILLSVFIVFIAGIVACSKDNLDDDNKATVTDDKKVMEDNKVNEQNNEENEANIPEVTQALVDSTKKTEPMSEVRTPLEAESQSMALQMVKGDFDTVYNRLAPDVKTQVSIESLMQAWNATVKGIGEYIGVYSYETKRVDGLRQVVIVLQYQYNGLKVTFTYNNADELLGIVFNYALIQEEAVVNDIFEEKEITFGEGKYKGTGIITLPKGVNKPPVAILVHGSGNHDLNESIGANKPFRDLAWKLAEQGIATIRYNERVFMYQELLAEYEFTIDVDCLYDVADAIDYAVNSEEIDNTRIYIIGHSLGGMMAPKIASDNPEVDGIILLAGSPRKLEDILFDQLLAELKNTNITAEEEALYINIYENEIKKIKDLKEGGNDVILGAPTSYWYSLNKIDIGMLAKELTIPMFIAQGTEDYQVYADKDYPAWKELLKDKSNVSYKLYDKLNHIFIKSNGNKDFTEYETPSEVDQQVIDDIAKWIKSN